MSKQFADNKSTLRMTADGVYEITPDGETLTLYEPSEVGRDYHAREESNVLLYGNRGGGKSTTMRWDAHFRALSYGGFVYGILRRTFPELHKAVTLDTEVQTPTGPKRMGDIHVGDTVIAIDGTPTQVIGESPIHIDPNGTYRVTFDNGESITTSAGHGWMTQTAQERGTTNRIKRGHQLMARTAVGPTMRTTAEIASSLYVENGKRNNHSIQVASTWNLPDATLPMDPYVLGTWLGDGTRNQGAITCADQPILDEIERAGYPVRKHPSHQYGYGLLGIAADLKKAGVFTKKHIPTAYLYGSAKQRLGLLQGLMDTDGSASKGGLSTFVNTNINLAQGVYTLAASFGLKPRWSSRLTRYIDGRLTGTTTFIVQWSGNFPCFRLPRKLARLKPANRGVTSQHYIVACERTLDQFCKCIAVAHPSQQFLIGRSCIPTHNSHIEHLDKEMDLLGGYYNRSKNIAYYPNGSIGYYSHCSTPQDVLNLLGGNFMLLGFDELTTFEWEMFTKLKTSVRAPKNSGVKAFVRGTTNPLGVSTEEVWKYFVEKDVDPEEDAEYVRNDWHAIRMQLSDNKFLDEGDYRKQFVGLPAHVMKAWVDGDYSPEHGLFEVKPTIKVMDDEGVIRERPYHFIRSIPTYEGDPIFQMG